MRATGEPALTDHVDEKWEPSSRDLVAELPELYARMRADGFTVRRVMYNPADWEARVPRRTLVDGETVKLGAYNYQDRRTVMVVDDDGRNRVTLTLPVEAAQP